MKYILDTNAYIEAHKGYYHPDICMNYWDILKELGNSDKIKSPKQVKEEITTYDDELAKWTKNRNKCFLSEDLKGIQEFFLEVSKVYENYKEEHIERWRKKWGKSYKLPKDESISDEDMFVIATVIFYKKHFPNQSITLVTKEIYKEHRFKPVRIPHLCRELEIRWMNDFDFIKEVGIKFEAKINF